MSFSKSPFLKSPFLKSPFSNPKDTNPKDTNPKVKTTMSVEEETNMEMDKEYQRDPVVLTNCREAFLQNKEERKHLSRFICRHFSVSWKKPQIFFM